MSITVTILLISLGTFIFLAWYFSHRATHLERLRLIEKGINPDAVKNDDTALIWKKLGVIAIGLGTGLILISVLVLVAPRIANVNAVPLGILVLCCGIALVISNKYKKF